MRFRRLSNTFPNKLPPLKKTVGLIHGRTPLQPGGAGGLVLLLLPSCPLMCWLSTPPGNEDLKHTEE